MIDKKYHIIITGETSSARSFLIHRHTIKKFIQAAVIGTTILILIIIIGSWKGIAVFKTNKELQAQVAELSGQLVSQETGLQGFADTGFDERLIEEKIEIVVNEHFERRNREQREMDKTPEGGEQTAEKRDDGKVLPASVEERIADSRNREEALPAYKQALLEDTINRLDERSRLIESVMDKIGVYVKVKEDEKHSGGPYISPEQAYSERLLNRTDHYINVLEKLPLGRPVCGEVTSRFGWRTDPFLKKPALHGGIDIKGKIGDKVEATAAGKVVFTGYDRGGYGHYVKISHDNNYESIFGHLSKITVKKGDTVKRRQVIGLLGNSGRSTGPHLHYELRYKGRHINPARYMRVADLVFFLSN